ncbi:MAG: AlpA family phage regulatory protein [Paracoccaceae bacterium]|nr:AlpA family phage regulatory protein [Paracoccaceae bacterium]
MSPNQIITERAMPLALKVCANRRIFDKISAFDTLPDTAVIDLKTVRAFSGRSKTSIYRDVAAGRLSKPVRIGPQAVRWRVGNVRAYLSGTTK